MTTQLIIDDLVACEVETHVVELTNTGAGNFDVPANVVGQARVQCIGPCGKGGSSSATAAGGGGGGGASAESVVTLTPSVSIPYHVGKGNVSGNGEYTSWNNDEVKAAAGKNAPDFPGNPSGGAGGPASDCVGDVKASGQNGTAASGMGPNVPGVGGNAAAGVGKGGNGAAPGGQPASGGNGKIIVTYFTKL